MSARKRFLLTRSSKLQRVQGKALRTYGPASKLVMQNLTPAAERAQLSKAVDEWNTNGPPMGWTKAK